MEVRFCLRCKQEFRTTGRYRRCRPCRRRTRDKRRRALLKRNFVEKVEKVVLYQRDKGICQLCLQPVAFKNAEVDHIVPIARGGKHSYENTQIAHSRCNKRKGSSLAFARGRQGLQS